MAVVGLLRCPANHATNRPNLFIKITAMEDGLSAITAVIGQGISVNVTLIFPWSATGS